eukprot:5206402-Alexandrium_andersonii.AAC.1
MDLRGRNAPGDLLPVHPRAVHVDVQSAPIGTRWAANEQTGSAGGDESARPLGVFRDVRVPRLASRTRAQ